MNKYNEFKSGTICIDCLGCEKCENPFFEGVKECEWKVIDSQNMHDIINQIKSNIKNSKRKDNPNQVRL